MFNLPYFFIVCGSPVLDITGIFVSLIPDNSFGMCGSLLSANNMTSNLFLRCFVFCVKHV